MAANGIFLDTNGWVILLNTRENLHAVAETLWRQLALRRQPVVLTDWVVAETGNGLARTSVRREFPGAVRDLRGSPRVRLITLTPALTERALKLYEERPDKTWGLVDCASFVVMQDEGIADAFTTDRHFEQAGFNCLLPAAAP